MPATDKANHRTYTRADIVRYYAQLHQLQPAEAAIRDCLKRHLPNMKMLDVGVGGGRTTAHFAPLVRRYVGVDYSLEMVAACRQRYPTATLQVADARQLPFADSRFDFVLFSFNGIDYMDHGDRQQCLRELHRVVRPGGYLCFSSHNLPAMVHQFGARAQLRWNPLRAYTNLVMLGLLRWHNRDISRAQLAQADYAMLTDESHNFRLRTYYVRPEVQLQQLSRWGDVWIYPWACREPYGLMALPQRHELWLYYFCQVTKAAI